MLLILSIQELNKFSEIVTGQILITTVKRIVYKMDQGNNKANSDIFMRKLSFLGFGVSLISNCLIRALDLIHCIKKKIMANIFYIHFYWFHIVDTQRFQLICHCYDCIGFNFALMLIWIYLPSKRCLSVFFDKYKLMQSRNILNCPLSYFFDQKQQSILYTVSHISTTTIQLKKMNKWEYIQFSVALSFFDGCKKMSFPQLKIL